MTHKPFGQMDDDDLRSLAEDYAELVRAGWPLQNDKQANARGLESITSGLRKKWGLRTNSSVRNRIKVLKEAGLEHIWQEAIDERASAVADSKIPDPYDTAERLIEDHKIKAENSRLKAENRALLKRLTSQEDFTAALSGLSDPLEPVSFQNDKRDESRNAETIILFLSDLQWGEKIDLANMDGLNSYDSEIARRRLGKVFTKAIEFGTDHWPANSPPPERIILVLGGDMISGEIHMELAKSNTLLSIPAVRDCASHIIAGIRALYDAFGCKIDIISVPGNHGRTTIKPESKFYAEHSYDTLVADLVELEFKANGEWPDWFRMWKPVSGDALIWVYGYRFLITHGDRIGSRGGQGFVGAAATVARGFKKLVMDYAGRGITLDFIMCGHFHVALWLEEGICNGSLPGPSEYSRDGRYRPRPAVQAFLTVHPRHGVTQVRWINPGSPDEGALYDVKSPPPKDQKPRFRVPAIGERV